MDASPEHEGVGVGGMLELPEGSEEVGQLGEWRVMTGTMLLMSVIMPGWNWYWLSSEVLVHDPSLRNLALKAVQTLDG